MAAKADIAKLVGVSKSSVSRVISGRESCKPETREKILTAIKQKNYSPGMHISKDIAVMGFDDIDFLKVYDTEFNMRGDIIYVY